jgi:hypothetical protein
MHGHAPAIVDSAKCDLAAEVLRESGSLRLRATGSSMLPSIWPGDVLIIQKRELEQIAAGETAVFFPGGRMTAHRVVSHHGNFLVTQGDSVPQPDAPVTAENLLGVVVSIERGGKLFAPALRPGLVARCTAAVLRRFDLATRVWLRVHLLFSPTSLKMVSPNLTASS